MCCIPFENVSRPGLHCDRGIHYSRFRPGQVAPSGLLPSAVPEVHGPLFVCLKPDDEAFANSLPGGASGEVAIYSSKGKPAQVICKVMIRMAAIKNYIVPN